MPILAGGGAELCAQEAALCGAGIVLPGIRSRPGEDLHACWWRSGSEEACVKNKHLVVLRSSAWLRPSLLAAMHTSHTIATLSCDPTLTTATAGPEASRCLHSLKHA